MIGRPTDTELLTALSGAFAAEPSHRLGELFFGTDQIANSEPSSNLRDWNFCRTGIAACRGFTELTVSCGHS